MEEAKDVQFEIATRDETSLINNDREDVVAGVSILSEDEVIALERAVPLLKRAKIAALQLTTSNDWGDLGGKPYMKASGAESLANTCGISWNNARMEVRKFQDEMGQYVEQYICTMTFYIKDRMGRIKRSIEVDGMASTDDDFFSERTNRETREKYRLPFSEVDVNSVRKKARTNCIERGVRKFLGLGGVTWKELAAAGIEPADKVEFNKGGKAPSAPSPEGKNTRAKLWGMLLDLSNGDEDIARAGCKKYSSFTGKDGKPVGFEDPNNPKISDKWVGTTYSKVEKIWREKGFDKIPPTPEPEAELPETREPGQEG